MFYKNCPSAKWESKGCENENLASGSLEVMMSEYSANWRVNFATKNLAPLGKKPQVMQERYHAGPEKPKKIHKASFFQLNALHGIDLVQENEITTGKLHLADCENKQVGTGLLSVNKCFGDLSARSLLQIFL